MWTYDQSSGELRNAKGQLVSKGYSGHGRGKNNPSLQGVRGVGPIPRGRWRMQSIYDSRNVGPRTITLWSLDDSIVDDRHEATGRSAFRIHGDSIRAPGTGSRGCIILPRAVRIAMAGNIQPDGSAMEPRKPRARRDGQRVRKKGRMFRKIALARNMKIDAQAEGVSISFVGDVRKTAEVHHFGLRDRVARFRGAPEVQYPSRRLMGFGDDDPDAIMQAVLDHMDRNSG